MGTQRLEAQVRKLFPEAVCLRMDTDTMQRAGSHEQALNRFRAGEVQILLGTQMIAKGLDFPNVTLVGVIQADLALHLQDFRSLERTFQLVTQVAGRTGRGPRGGRVIVQTLSPDLPVIRAAAHHDYQAFVRQELPRRQAMRYPPFSTLIRVVARGPQPLPLRDFMDHLAGAIREACSAASTPFRLMGPTIPQIDRLRGNHRRHLLVLSEDGAELRDGVRRATADLRPPDNVQIMIDVDAQSLI
jgi:primosomal protein N' (replication factor Y)